jgi:hypothetical protein
MEDRRSMKPLQVDIITYAPTAFFHCQHCEIAWQQVGLGEKARAEQMANNLPQDVMDDYRSLSDWIMVLVNKHQGRLAVRVVDAASVEGFLASLRHRARRYPAVIIAGQEVLSPADFSVAQKAIERRLPATLPPG